MSILVTGFEPFGGSSRNASWEAVSLLPETIAGHAVYRMRLPDCYGQAGDLLVEMMRRIRPTVTLCCGVAGGRKAITPELIAINYRRAAIADNADVLYAGEKIDPKRPDAHMTRLNVLRMVDAMKSAGLPADLSLSAGAYVCNDLYFALLDRGLTVGGEGVFVQTSTLGSLEALLEFLSTLDPPIPVGAFNIGPIHKRDVIQASIMLEKKKEFATILAFDVKIVPEAAQYAKEIGVRIFSADILYNLFDQFTAYVKALADEKKAASKEEAVFPCILKIIPQYIFNRCNPIVVGVDVVDGILKPGTPLCVVLKNVVELLLFFPDVLEQVASVVTALPLSMCELSLNESGELSSRVEGGELSSRVEGGELSSRIENGELLLAESGENITFPSSTESEENANAEEVLQQTYKRMRALRKRIEKANQALRSLESKPGRLDDFVSIEQRQELIVRNAAKSHV